MADVIKKSQIAAIKIRALMEELEGDLGEEIESFHYTQKKITVTIVGAYGSIKVELPELVTRDQKTMEMDV